MIDRTRMALLVLAMMLPLRHAQAEEPTPRLLCELPFDGNPDAVTASSKPHPLKAEALHYADGVKGQAVLISRDSFLEYATEGNLNQERGTVTLWFKPNWRASEQSSDDRAGWHCLFSEPFPKSEPGKDSRQGSGALWLWFWGATFRGDVSDIHDQYLTAGAQGLNSNTWAHIALTWDVDKGSRLYLNGASVGMVSDGTSPLDVGKGAADFSALRNRFASFCVGSQEREAKADGLLDELRIYDRALSPEEIASDMALISPFRLDGASSFCMAGETADLKWTIRNSTRKDAGCACSWRITDPGGATVAAGRETSLRLKAGESRQMVTKVRTEARGEYRLVVETSLGPSQSASLWALGRANPALKGTASTLDTRLIETIDLVKGLSASRFTSIGVCAKRTLGERSYFEAGPKKNDRFAIRLELPAAGVPYLIEWDYPDDKLRTMEMVGQSALDPGNDYGLQTGVFCGDEYPLSMRTLTHRSILWARARNTALIFMTAREGAPAAVSELRISAVQGGLPDAGVREAAPIDGWTRTIGIHFEDPAMGYDFGIERADMPEYEETLDRLIAYMKWSGQNLLSYPAVWYHGRIDTSYQPRPHPDNFIGCILTAFAANGLGFMPTINFQNISLPEGVVVNARTVADGSLYRTPVMILSNGRPNPGGWHGTPPNFNPLHPDVQRYVDAQVDDLLERYAANPAFKGIVLHLTKHTIPWFGSIEAGYNDDTIDAFEAETGIRVPADRGDPLRGKRYHDWLMANAREAWVQWRCGRIAAWYKAIAARMAARRPDLKLSICSYNPTISDHHDDPRYGQPDFVTQIDRESGIDARLYAGIPNIILCQTIYPADYRATAGDPWVGAARAVIRDMHATPGLYSMLNGAACPWINMHDRYFEDAIGREGQWWGGTGHPLKAAWLKEMPWRVSTLNPNVDSFLEHYILPLRFNDVLGFTKGGFLLGTCGVEEKLAAFARAYRALPARRFTDLAGSTETVRVRWIVLSGSAWFYAVNTSRHPCSVSLVFDQAPGPIVELGANGERVASDRTLSFDLKPDELRAFKGGASACPRAAHVTGP